jgi:hypothetical protein
MNAEGSTDVAHTDRGRSRVRRLALAAAVALAASVVAWPVTLAAWSGEAHRTICEIAWLRLEPQARQMVRDLLRDEPRRLFNAVCTWADEVRDTTHPQTAAYHYVNIPAGTQGFDMARDCGDRERRCIVWAIDQYARILADRSRPHSERNEALKFVAHFIGDLHQPLHAGRPEDRGGNDIRVRFFGDAGPRDRPLTLHRVWDAEILERAGHRWRPSAQRLHARITPAEAAAWATLDIVAWTNESFRIADAFVYPELPRDRNILTLYHARALDVSELQIQKAGVRLAHVLNRAASGRLDMPRLPS